MLNFFEHQTKLSEGVKREFTIFNPDQIGQVSLKDDDSVEFRPECNVVLQVEVMDEITNEMKKLRYVPCKQKK